MNVVCVVVDRLRAAAVGPYGQTNIETEAWNQLAVRGLLADLALADASDLAGVYRGFWQGRLAADRRTDRAQRSLARLLAEAGLQTVLLTDEPRIAALPEAADFAELATLPPSRAERPAPALDGTQGFALFAAAAQWLERPPERFFLWVHAQGLEGPWDAPREFRDRLRDEDDPPAWDGLVLPVDSGTRKHDPDVLLGYRQAYLAQVAALDACLSPLLDVVAAVDADRPTLLCLLGARGLPLGEHAALGGASPCPHEEALHVPWLVRWPDGFAAADRIASPTLPADLFATVARAGLGPEVPLPAGWGLDLRAVAAGETPPRRFAALGSETARAVRTPAWHLAWRPPDGAPRLYAKPDDRWEANDVASRLPEVVEELQALDAASAAALDAEEGGPLPELPALLVDAAV